MLASNKIHVVGWSDRISCSEADYDRKPDFTRAFPESRGRMRRQSDCRSSTYTDSDFHLFEIESVFGSEWLCVGRQEQIPNAGDYLAVTRAQEPLIIVRNGSGSISAMSGVCQHRGMCLSASVDRSDEEMLDRPQFDPGSGRQFRCPYHYWVYDLDGRLVGAPEMAQTPGFNLEDIRLPQLAVEVWKGFIFVNFSLRRSAPCASPPQAGSSAGQLRRRQPRHR